jgi:SAM-dependent methyltransferase
MAYDTVAVDCAELLRTELERKPLDRAMLGTFAELVQASGGGPVADLGCGPGRIAAYLHSLELSAFGIDLSPAMVAVASSAHPDLRFEGGSMLDLDLADGLLGGIVSRHGVC